MWSLTLERKQELLKQRDLKLQEVADLEKKTPSNLWLDDLDNLLNVMEVQEAKEADDGSMAGKKGAKLKGPGSKKLMLAAETLPSPKGRRVEPLIDPELRKKIEKAGKKELVPDAEDEFDLMSGEVKPLEQRIGNSPQLDEFDLMSGEVKPLEQRIGNSPQLVEKKLQEKRKAAKAKFSFDSDDEDMVAEANGDASSDFEEEKPVAKRQRVFDSDSDDSDFGHTKKKAKPPPKQLESSDTLFDKLVSGNSGSDAIMVDSSP
ncbi:hypothetical protein B566_EDAN018589, partial [Ephemera danica]